MKYNYSTNQYERDYKKNPVRLHEVPERFNEFKKDLGKEIGDIPVEVVFYLFIAIIVVFFITVFSKSNNSESI